MLGVLCQLQDGGDTELTVVTNLRCLLADVILNVEHALTVVSCGNSEAV